LANTIGPSPRCSFAEDDPRIVWRHLDVYAVSNDREDAIATHLASSVADDAMVIVQGDADAAMG
jgi:hypothetical protein